MVTTARNQVSTGNQVPKRPSLILSNTQFSMRDVGYQIKCLKAQFMYLRVMNPTVYNEESFQKAIRSLCGRTAKFYGLSFDKSKEGLEFLAEVQSLISKLRETDEPEAVSDHDILEEVDLQVASPEEVGYTTNKEVEDDGTQEAEASQDDQTGQAEEV